jgi:hypothetical protein
MSESINEQEQFEQLVQETHYKNLVLRLLNSLKEADFEQAKEEAILKTVLAMEKLSFEQVVKVQSYAISILTQEQFEEVFL